ncbi:MAG: hypothetical protein MI700_11915 [Balneolales bacterium]|nr:hypothetical protein [Balneolales bacterium]
MRTNILLFILLFVHCTDIDYGTEIFLGEYSIENGLLIIKSLENISQNPGYDNQPSFSGDGKDVLFSSTRNDQTDILQYTVSSGAKNWLSNTAGSEYSPTSMYGDSTVSSILLKPDGEQLLWSYPITMDEPSVIAENEVIGYHTWYDSNNLYTFVLSDSTNPNSTLVQFNLTTNERTVLAENIGRSLHRIPGSTQISFIQKGAEVWTINAYNHASGEIEVLTETLPEAEDMAWLSESILLMGSGSILWMNDLGSSRGWTELQDLSGFGVSDITRLAVHTETNQIAVVSTL